MGITRVSRAAPCPVCDGHPELDRGEGRRCVGFITSDGAVGFCTRSEKAGDIALDLTTTPEAYPHRLTGECKCGTVHGEGEAKVLTLRAGTRAKLLAVYPYENETGVVQFEVCRYEPKSFKQRRPNPNVPGDYLWSLKGVDRIPYRLPELSKFSGAVFVCEGEKDVDRLLAMGLPATTAPGGAGKWTSRMAQYLRGRTCVILPDNDDAGRSGANVTARIFASLDIDCKILELENLPEHGDVSDWLTFDAQNNDANALSRLAATTPDYEPPPADITPGQDDSGDGDPLDAFTDTRNALRLIRKYGEKIRFDHTHGQWRIWDGNVWGADETEAMVRMAKSVVQRMHEEVLAMGLDRKELHAARQAVLRVESTGRLKSMLENARSEVPATHKTWDPDPYWFNCANGTIDLRTGELLEHRPERWQSKLSPVAYDPEAKCPKWEAFLSTIFGADQDLIGFVQRSVGLSLIGTVLEHVLYVMWGTGANGKSTFLDVILEVLGDYARAAAPDLLMHADLPQHSTNIAELRGVRFVSAVETDEGARMSEALVKMLTGGDTRNCRFMHENAFTYVPSDTFWMATNSKPVVRGNSEGIWRRLKLIPFNVKIPEDQQVRDFHSTLRSEHPGILAWAVRGCLDWQRSGLGEPNSVLAATAGYRGEMDTLNAFLEERCVRGVDYQVSSADLYKQYSEWCQEAGERVTTKRFLGLRLGEHGFKRVRMGKTNRWGWAGIRLRGEGELFGDEEPAIRAPRQENIASVEMVSAEGEPNRANFATDEEHQAAVKQYWIDRGENW